MRALYLKLAVLFFLVFGIAVYIVNSSHKQPQTINVSPFYHKLKEGEWYGSFSISELVALQSGVAALVNNSFFTYDEPIQELVQDRLKDLGLLHGTIYFSGNFSKKELFAYIPLHTPKKLAKELTSIAAALDWERIDTLEQTIYTTLQNDVKIIQAAEMLILTNSKENQLDYFVEHKPTRFIELDSLFSCPNKFAIQTPLMHQLGIDYIAALINLSFPLQLNGSMHTTAPFPFSSGTHSSVVAAPNTTYQTGSNIAIDTSLFTTHWYRWFDQLQSHYGVPVTAIAKSWNGNLVFEKGGTMVKTDTIVSYEFDANFNEVATEKIVKKEVKGFSILLGSENSNSLIAALGQNNFLSFKKEKYFFPMSPALFLQHTPQQLILSSYEDYQFQKEENTNSFYFKALKEGWFVRANIDRKSSTLLEFEVSVGEISRHN